MKKKEISITLVGVVVGLVLGYAYYHYIGCVSGSCSITSKPLNSSLYGGLMGGLLLNMIYDFFKKKSPK
ncbi:DUF6132 domain-containing protein [Flavobacterium cucumis]|uniref:YtxH domain-containing protein n=1 Tax=Flavobacterium cucumis TaxID=416016 RepID=A0A1M7ZW23_9FLAO|nr:DUF6132 family protein [Flavobacterium cucumis]SHO73056.1 hypothetical protein SAMN05443547_1406 [Flavobacterium cucumis]